MKKLLIMMFLILGTLSFVNSGKIIKPMVMPKETVLTKTTVNSDESAVWCCTIGPHTACGRVGEDLCGEIRRQYYPHTL